MIRRGVGAVVFAALPALISIAAGAEPAEAPLRLVVMDPLSAPLACDCVAGYARRDYGRLAEHVEDRLGRPLVLAFAESLLSRQAGASEGVDLVIGKFSEVRSDAARAGLALRTLAMLSGKDGRITQTGMFIVRGNDPAKSIADLADHRLLLGPADAAEKHAAAIASLDAFNLPVGSNPSTSPGCNTAALAVVENDADAAVISSYAMPLLEGCGTIKKGELRIVGHTDPVPFIGVFVADRVDGTTQRTLATALAGVAGDAELLAALESQRGFVPFSPIAVPPERQWPDWRGPGRQAISDDVPRELRRGPQLLWSRILTGPGMGGVAVAQGRVLVVDKSLDGKSDVFRCLDADSGDQRWKLEYPAPERMDYTNSPRATPVVHEGLVYLFGAFGDLHCVRLESGRVVWKRNLAEDFGAELPTWGYCSTPLVVDDKLIVNPGGPAASLVALDRLTGDVLWQTPGDPPGYAAFILAELGGVRQVIGYDAVSLGGWDPDFGQRLWTLVPEFEGDFNVPTPIVVDDQLLVSTENNGTRLYGFDDQGRILPDPVAENEDLIPDTSTPVVHQGLVLGNCGGMFCLDLNNGLKTLWETDEDPFFDYCSFIAGGDRFLVTSQLGTVSLLEADGQELTQVGQWQLFEDVPDGERDVWSHPALVGHRLYVRNLLAVYCFLLD